MRHQGERQKAVWLAMSELFLDVDVDDVLAGVTDALKTSGYSAQDLDLIMVDEVYPVCHWNLRSVAGVWAGFDPGWLYDRCAARAALPQWRKTPLRGLRRWGLRRLLPEWTTILATIR